MGSVAAGGATAAALTAFATAFACSPVMGPLVLSPTSGPAGTTITTSASGLKMSATYALHFGKGTTQSCMGFTGVITLKKIKASSTGTWDGVTAVIPSTATQGTHSLCGVEISPAKGSSGTDHHTFTVV